MARPKIEYACQSCGGVSPKWAGRCAHCGAWNTLVEEAAVAAPVNSVVGGKGRAVRFETLAGATDDPPRIPTGLEELDRALGGGLAPGSAILVGGDPGIGKSTLLTQACAALARAGRSVVYISGEESTAQVRQRAARLGMADAPVQLAAETGLRDILTSLDLLCDDQDGAAPAMVVIDSIQTIWSDVIESAPGGVSQVRAAAHDLVRWAKRRGAAMVLVGHVTKDGQIAGPRVVEHMVDTVLYFEGERAHRYRILRAVKNRFGPADEIGVFEMTGEGLREAPNPSELFLGERDEAAPGAAVFAGVEGSRPVLVEIQALVAKSVLATPRRAVVGWDGARLAMALAVLDARCGLSLSGLDIYLNVAGGLRVTEPAADLAVAAALVSSAFSAPLPRDSVVFGEIALSGSVRAAPQAETRLREAARLGFTRAIMPARNLDVARSVAGLRDIDGLDALAALVDKIAGDATPLRAQSS